jgi:FG-GAP-like repeat
LATPIATASRISLSPTGTAANQILLGRGDGTFIVKPFASLSTYGNFGALMITDYNGDGLPDLIIANEGNYLGYSGTGEVPSLIVLSGYGDGTFNNALTYADAGNSGKGLAQGDMNGDGRADLLVYNMLSSDISIKMRSSTAAITPAPAVGYATVDSYRSFVALLTGDVNGDSKRDVLLVNTQGVQVLLGIAAAICAPPPQPISKASPSTSRQPISTMTEVPTWSFAASMSATQTGYVESDNLYLALGNRSQALTRKGPFFGTGTGSNLGPLGVGNFNTEATSTSSYAQASCSITAAPVHRPQFAALEYWRIRRYPRRLQHRGRRSEWRGQGRPRHRRHHHSHRQPGQWRRNLKPDVTYSLGGTGSNAVVLRDINGDGKLDAITANHGSLSVSVFLGNGDGTFPPAREFNLPQTTTPIDRPVAVASGDFNRDGKQDIAVARLNSISILLGTGRADSRMAPRSPPEPTSRASPPSPCGATPSLTSSFPTAAL